MPYSPYTGSPSGLVAPSTQIVPVYVAGEDRSSAFSPLQFPNLAAWYDGSRVTGLADGDPVATWLDLSGNGNHATQATSSQRPSYRVSVQNGLPALRWDGVDDWMTIPTLGDVQTTLVLVARTTAGAGYQVGMIAAKQMTYVRLSSSGNWGGNNGGDLVSGANATSMTIMVQISRAFNDVDLITNGTLVNKTNGVSYTTRTGALGGVNGSPGVQTLSGDIAEAMTYTRALSTGEWVRLVRALGKKYAISVAV